MIFNEWNDVKTLNQIYNYNKSHNFWFHGKLIMDGRIYDKKSYYVTVDFNSTFGFFSNKNVVFYMFYNHLRDKYEVNNIKAYFNTIGRKWILV